jgi:hypothetical protein
METDADIEKTLENEYSDFVEETKVLAVGDACPICQSRLDLVDFSAKDYARFLNCVPVPAVARGKPYS